MRSKHRETKLQTSCKECLFAIYDVDTQIGCEAGRIKAFGKDILEAYDDEKEFFVINGVCNYFRYEETETSLEQAIEECKKTFSFVIYADDVSEEVALEKTKNDIIGIDYDRDKFNVVISQPVESYESDSRKILASFCSDLRDAGVNVVVVVCGVRKARDHESFKHASTKSFFSKICFGQEIPSDMLLKIDRSINVDLKKCVFFDCDGVRMVMFSVLNLLYGKYKDFDRFIEETEKDAKTQGLYLRL